MKDFQSVLKNIIENDDEEMKLENPFKHFANPGQVINHYIDSRNQETAKFEANVNKELAYLEEIMGKLNTYNTVKPVVKTPPMKPMSSTAGVAGTKPIPNAAELAAARANWEDRKKQMSGGI